MSSVGPADGQVSKGFEQVVSTLHRQGLSLGLEGAQAAVWDAGCPERRLCQTERQRFEPGLSFCADQL